MTDPSLTEMVQELKQSQQAFLEILNRADEAVLYHRPDGENWTLAEVLVHIAEARQFFAAETRKVLAAPGAKVGRTLDDPHRLRNVEEHARDTPAEIRQKLVASHQSMVNTLAEISAEDLRLEVEHIKFGSQPLADFIRRFMIGHDQIHVEQAASLLGGQPEVE